MFEFARRIPKIIHYVWVGGMPLSLRESKKFIASWIEFNPKYKLILWDEAKIDLTIPYLKNAYEHRCWANVSNLVRLMAIYRFGGIYLDTDVRVVKSFDELRKNRCFFGFQVREHETDWVNNAVFGAVGGHWLIKKAIDYLLTSYDGTEQANLSSPVLITKLLKEIGLEKYDDKGVRVKDIIIYPVSCFYPFSWDEKFTPGVIKENTYAIHYWQKRWE